MAADTDGELITGKYAERYNLRLPLWRFIRQGHMRQVRLNGGQRLLDVGFGTGTTLQLLSKKYGNTVELYGVEPSHMMLQQAQALVAGNRHVHLQVAPAEALPFSDGLFDWVTCSLVMHHLPLATKRRALKEMRRVLRPGGTLVLTDWGKPVTLFGRFVAFLWRNHAYMRENRTGVLEELLQQEGFGTITVAAIQCGVVYHFTASR